MTKLTIAIQDKAGELRTATRGEEQKEMPLTDSAEHLVHLAMKNFKYQEGDQIVVRVDQPEIYLMVKLDETLDTSLIYLSGNSWSYPISFLPNALAARPKERFAGESHYLSVRIATAEEVDMYQNLALNPHDQKVFTGSYPHADANVETRNDATFFACNAIDGIHANHSHGPYPFQSWGINQQQDAALTVLFGREVELDKVVFTWRADFPHDSYWTRVSLRFSDGTKEVFQTIKTAGPQSFTFKKRRVTAVTFDELIQADDNSPFPALTQIECFGRNVNTEENQK